MRNGLLCATTLAIAFSGAILAQAPPAESEGRTNLIRKLPGYVRLLPRTLMSNAADRGVATPAFSGAMRALKPSPKPDCAHILMVPATPDIDLGIQKKVDPSKHRMPVHRGLPPCPEDRR